MVKSTVSEGPAGAAGGGGVQAPSKTSATAKASCMHRMRGVIAQLRSRSNTHVQRVANQRQLGDDAPPNLTWLSKLNLFD
jgi:hypothetical protein